MNYSVTLQTTQLLNKKILLLYYKINTGVYITVCYTPYVLYLWTARSFSDLNTNVWESL